MEQSRISLQPHFSEKREVNISPSRHFQEQPRSYV